MPLPILAVYGEEPRLGIRSGSMVLGWLEDVLVGVLAALVIALTAWLAGIVLTGLRTDFGNKGPVRSLNPQA